MHAIQRQFQSVGDAKLVVDLAQVILDDLFGGAHFLGDIFVLETLGSRHR